MIKKNLQFFIKFITIQQHTQKRNFKFKFIYIYQQNNNFLNSNFMNFITKLFIIIIGCLLHNTIALTGNSMNYNDIPSLTPANTTITASSVYNLSTYLAVNLSSTAYFQLDFTSSQLSAANGLLTCSYTYASVIASISNCSCTNNICIIAPGTSFNSGNNLLLTFGNINNPFYIASQTVTISVQINSTRYAIVNVSVSGLLYSNLPIIANSISQSDYSVGGSNVTYNLNFSILGYVPPNPQLQLILPPQINLNYLSYSMIFYNSNQTNPANFLSTGTQQSLTIFTSSVNQSINISGWVSLNITGFINPQFIGNSSSFTIIVKTNCASSGSGCSVANLTSGLYASANSAGYLPVLTLNSNSMIVNTPTIINVNLLLFAAIPINGQLNILLPSGITPNLPITCSNIGGFSIVNGSVAMCSYNSTTNIISTVNFAYPYIATSSSAAISFGIINPSDTSDYLFYFQSLDQYGRIIGSTRSPYVYNCDPGTLYYTIFRNDSTVNAYLTLTISINFSNNIPPNGNLQLLIPYEMVNTTSTTPICKINSNPFSCNSSVSVGNSSIFNLTFVPVCSQGCVANSVFNFSITNIVNPSYINSQAFPIVIQTTNQYFTGIVDTNSIYIQNLGLTMSTSNISKLIINGTNVVGSQQIISLTFSISSYFQYNDGIISINFPPNSTFIFNSPIAYVASGTQNISIALSYSLYDQNMKSISMINVSQACILTSCSNQLTIMISGITYSYSTLNYSPYNFTIYTIGGSPISFGIINFPQLVLTTKLSSLSIISSNLITGSLSNYNISFIPTLPIDNLVNGGYITIILPPQLTYSSNVCSVNANISISFTLSCTVSNGTIMVFYNNGIPQTLQGVLLSIILSNAINPYSTIPLTYKITSYYNNAPSEIFSSTFSIPNLSTGSVTSSKTNNTFNISATLNIICTFSFNVTNQDIVTLYAPIGIFSFINTTLLSNSLQVATILTSNTTYQMISFTPIASSNLLNISLSIVNPTSTMQFSNMIITSNRLGYSSQALSLSIPPCLPSFLPLLITTTNQRTGDLTNLTINLLHNINSINFKIVLPVIGWTYSQASLSASSMNPLVNNTLINLNSSANATITLYNLTNKMDISPVINSVITLICYDSSGNSVESSSYNISSLVATIPSSIIVVGIRSNPNSLQSIQLNLSITNFNIQNNLTLVYIDLPSNQFNIINSSTISCIFSSNLTSMQSCTISYISSDSTKIRIQTNHPCNTFACYNTKYLISINGISNYYADTSSTNISFYQNGYLSQNASFMVTPNIMIPSLNNPLILLGSNMISQNNIVTLSFSTSLPIFANSSIIVNFGDLIFLKNNDCTYTFGNTSANGCNYTFSINGYVLSAQFITTTMINPNINIQITFSMINAYAQFNISSAPITISIVYSNFTIASSSTTMNNILNSNTFNTVSFSSASISRSSAIVNTIVTLNFSLTVPINFYYNSIISIAIPKDQIYIQNTSGLTCYNCTILYTSQDISYYYYNTQYTNCQSAVCSNQTFLFSISGLSNNLYPKFSPNMFVVSFNYNGSVVCSPISIGIISLIASQAAISASRSIPAAFSNSVITINFSLLQPINTSVNIILIPNSYILYNGINNITLGNSTAPVSFVNQIVNNYLSNCTITLPQVSSSFILSLQVINSPLVTISGSTLNISIYNSTLLFYTNQLITISNQITPYNNNISLIRSMTTVASPYSLNINYNLSSINNLNGFFLSILSLSGSSCNNCTIANNLNIFPLSSNYGTLTVNNLTNPNDLNQFSLNITISSSTYIAYSGPVLITPSLTAIPFLAQSSFSNFSTNAFNNITISNLPILNSSINLTIPLQVFQTIHNIYQNNIALKNWTDTINSTSHFIQICCGLINISTLILQVVNPISVQQLNATILATTKLPYSVGTISIFLNLISSQLGLSFISTSYKINQISNYTIILNIVNISSDNFIDLQLPFSPILSNINYTTINSTSIRITKLINMTTLQLIFSNVTNPSNDKQLIYSCAQISNITGALIAFGSNSFQMTQLGLITISYSQRNSSKLNAPISMIFNITFENSGSLLSIIFSASQIYNNNITINCIDMKTNKTLSCVNQGLQLNITANWSGSAQIQINGYFNNKYNQQLTLSDTIIFSMFDVNGYQVAKSTNQVLLAPEATTGNITITNYIQSSKVMFSLTNLNFSFSLQDPLTSNSILIIQQNYSYIFPNSIQCYINNIIQNCSTKNNQTIIQISNSSLMNGNVSIFGLYNSIAPGLININTMDTTHLANIDTVTLNNQFTYSAFPLSFRVILEMNTIGAQALQIILDNNIPFSSISSSNFIVNLSISNTNLINANIKVDSINLQSINNGNNLYINLQTNQFNILNLSNVQFKQNGTSEITLQVLYNNVIIATGTKSVLILPQTSTFCTNSNCNLCSSTPNGQYCLICQVGQFSQNGTCVTTCPDKTYAATTSCQPCSINCNTCFDAYLTTCLTCNPPLIDNSGICTTSNNCSSGTITSGYCLGTLACALGCNICSPAGFCYQCSDGYTGIGYCTKKNSVVSSTTTFFTYFVIPPLLLFLLGMIYTIVGFHGFTSFLGMAIFTLSLTEFLCNVFLIPLMNTMYISIWISSLIIIRIVMSIVSYQGYFKSYIYKNDPLIVKEITWKDKLIGFFGQIINVDSYMLYLSKIGTPVLQKNLPFAKGIKIFSVVNNLIRFGLMFSCIYFLSIRQPGDLTSIPLICVLSQLSVILCHILANNFIFSKLISCINAVLRRGD